MHILLIHCESPILMCLAFLGFLDTLNMPPPNNCYVCFSVSQNFVIQDIFRSFFPSFPIFLLLCFHFIIEDFLD